MNRETRDIKSGSFGNDIFQDPSKKRATKKVENSPFGEDLEDQAGKVRQTEITVQRPGFELSVEERKADFQRRKEAMLEYAEEEGCFPQVFLLLELAQAQDGFTNEGGLFDYHRRESAQERTKEGLREPVSQLEIFHEYGKSGSDWLRSLAAFQKAIHPGDGVTPGLFTISNMQQDEWNVFDQWCQKNFLRSSALFAAKEAVRKNQRVGFSDLQILPREKIGRVLLRGYSDQVFYSDPTLDKKRKAIHLPLTGLAEKPTLFIRPDRRTAYRDASRLLPSLFIAAHLEAKRSPGQQGAAHDFYAHGIHHVNPQDLFELAPELFTELADRGLEFSVSYGEVQRTWLFAIRGAEHLDYSGFGTLCVNAAEGEDAVDVFVDSYLIPAKHMMPSFVNKNLDLLKDENDEVAIRSNGAITKTDLSRFDLAHWYKQRLQSLGNISTREDAEKFADQLTLTLEDVIGKERASAVDSFPESFTVGDEKFRITYQVDPEGKKRAVIHLDGYKDNERSRVVVRLRESDIPSVGSPEDPATIIYNANTGRFQTDEEGRIVGSAYTDNLAYIEKDCSSLAEAIDFIDAHRLDDAWEKFAGTENKAGRVPQRIIPFDPSKDFLRAKEIALEQPLPKLEPYTYTRTGEPLYPVFAVRCNEWWSAPSPFGIYFCRSKEVGEEIEAEARSKWEEMRIQARDKE